MSSTILPPAPDSPHLDGTDVLEVAPLAEPSDSWRLLVELTKETVRPGWHRAFSSSPPVEPP